MDWLTGDIIGAGAGLIGSLFGAGNSAKTEAEKAYWRQWDLMNHQYDLNVATMQNKHQYEVGDMKAAGINPLLSVIQPTGTLSTGPAPAVSQANPAQSAAALSQAFANIYSAKKQSDAAMLNAKANATQADAAMIKAQNDTTMTNFHVGAEFELKAQVSNAEMNNLIASAGLSKSQTAINLIQQEWIPKLLEANLNEYQMKIATGYLVAKAQDYYYRTSGDAAMVSAQASASQAAAHWYHESLYERSVANAEMLGYKEGELKEAQKKEALASAANIVEKTFGLSMENKLNFEMYQDPDYKQMRFSGRGIREFIGGPLGSITPW